MIDETKDGFSNGGRWKDLYRIGGISGISVAGLVVLAIGAFFIWPYNAENGVMSEILSNLQTDRIGGLLSLDLLMLIILIIYMLTILALYAVLRFQTKT